MDALFSLDQSRLGFEINQVENLTTHFEVFNARTSGTEAVELGEAQLAFEAPKKICAHGQLINLQGKLHFANTSHDFFSTGKVVECQELDSQTTKYTIKMHRFDKKLWDEFIASLSNRQNQVDSLFRSMRDED